MKKILITGNMGYLGPVIVGKLRDTFPSAELIGFDTGFFAHNITNTVLIPECKLDAQYFGDVRDFPVGLLYGVDAVVHLAAISNDPMGNNFEEVTMQINYEASVSIAKAAKTAGVKSFIFASSCSVYGFAESGARKESDQLNPLTAYAKSKIYTEEAINKLATTSFLVTALRFATACGMSERVRLDLVVNDFVAGAVLNNEIDILSDGSPWRPLIDVKDMALAVEWAINRNKQCGGSFLAVNIGSYEWNYRVRDLAEAVARHIPNTNVNLRNNVQPDMRSYKVDFSLFKELAPGYQPRVTIEQTILELNSGLLSMNFKEKDFRTSSLMRLKALMQHINDDRLDNNLRWKTRN